MLLTLRLEPHPGRLELASRRDESLAVELRSPNQTLADATNAEEIAERAKVLHLLGEALQLGNDLIRLVEVHLDAILGRDADANHDVPRRVGRGDESVHPRRADATAVRVLHIMIARAISAEADERLEGKIGEGDVLLDAAPAPLAEHDTAFADVVLDAQEAHELILVISDPASEAHVVILHRQVARTRLCDQATILDSDAGVGAVQLYQTAIVDDRIGLVMVVTPSANSLDSVTERIDGREGDKAHVVNLEEKEAWRSCRWQKHFRRDDRDDRDG